MTLSPGEAIKVPVRQWQRYPEYKDSGMEWLGEIPEHWVVISLKRVAKSVQTGSTPPTKETRYYEDGTIPWFGPGSFSSDLVLSNPVKFISEAALEDNVLRLFTGGSTMIVTIGATIGKVGYIETAASSNQQITGVTFDTSRMLRKFSAYQAKSLEPILRGIAPNTTLPILDQQEVGDLPFCCPPLPEQRAIADFLDRETARIDHLISRRERLISLLEEKRTTLISHTATKGLDSDAPMKDSGVEWLGEVQEHWDLHRIKEHVFSLVEKSPDTERPLVALEHISSGSGSLVDDYKPETVTVGDRILFEEGDILFGKLRPYLRKYWMAEFPGCCPTELLVLRSRSSSFTQRFLYYLVQTEYFVALANGTTYSVKMPRTSWEILGSQFVALPPLPEQHAIATFLDRETEKIDDLISRLREHVEKLGEYRTALISAAVTGKIDVREEAPSGAGFE